MCIANLHEGKKTKQILSRPRDSYTYGGERTLSYLILFYSNHCEKYKFELNHC